uniref:Uncharacterized protein n=1 Tax=Triticum urartu TaxID=4572 RepID=A0A8R7QB58_TRIUA
METRMGMCDWAVLTWYHAPPSYPMWNSVTTASCTFTRPVHEHTSYDTWVPWRSRKPGL